MPLGNIPCEILRPKGYGLNTGGKSYGLLNKAKLVKVKSWKGENNPNRHIVEFKLVHGWKFVPQGHWHSEEADETANRSFGYRKNKLF